MEQYHGTTIVSVRRGDQVALGGDGQVTLGNIVMKGTARKVRTIYDGKVMVGFAGATADDLVGHGLAGHSLRRTDHLHHRGADAGADVERA